MAMGLLYVLALWSNVCIIWGFGSIGFMTMMQLFPMVGHYRTDVISLCGSLRIGPDCAANVTYDMFSCNGWGTGIVLQVPRDSINPAEKG